MNLSMTCTEMTHLREKAPVVFRGRLDQCLSQISSLGYNGAEVHIHDSELIDRKKMKNELAQYGLELTSIGTGTAYGIDHLSLTSEEERVRQAAVDRIKGHILTASEYDHAVVILGLIRGIKAQCSNAETYEKLLLESLGDCCESASRYGVVLGIEVINRYECDYINNIDEGIALLETVDSPSLKLHLDTYHMNIEESDIREAILRAGDRIGHVHIADNDRWFAGHGHYDFAETVAALKDAGYGYALAVESLNFPDPVYSARKSYETMQRLI
ncbi:TIM barrel protein [Clostridium sp. MCC353]|uniref:sugar phosphate isomerase/epimerase family protein n=1 Tax=Clostridium sp. MCC353 TaxID=2592646 RepID=UPI001C016D80|nr:sugar phosphate isomerase/epimerase [Clostridium sp. MCC353]MBT9776835.1 TIM barrel protein [Clostridium sp. MCC353]